MPIKDHRRTAIIIGAGPAGLTAALELLRTTDIVPIILESTSHIGGISRTAVYKGNRIDIGGHRFFSKSDRILAWWRRILPLQGAPASDDLLLGRDLSDLLAADGPDPEAEDRVMLVRSRLSRILHHRKFFDYPLSLCWRMVRNLGAWRLLLIFFSYLRARLFPLTEEKNLEDFFINRFGRQLYLTFFKDYTEKVWGVPCTAIPSEWGAQRVKGLSVAGAVLHALRATVTRKKTVAQKDTETSLIERFLYPKLGPGQLWEEVARQVREKGGTILLEHSVVGLETEGDQVLKVTVRDCRQGREITLAGEFFFSSMPVRDLVAAMDHVPTSVRNIAAGLVYRDFLTVGLLLKKLLVSPPAGIKTVNNLIPDNWIYIQENDVRIGRVQIFNNWSPYLVESSDVVWLGLEYFCNEGEELWNMEDRALQQLGIKEMAALGFIDAADVLDGVIIRQPKAYPAYFGTYDRFQRIRSYTDTLKNLFLIGRNGMHRYNNMDHSMLAAMAAVEAARSGSCAKESIWAVNSEGDYHEAAVPGPAGVECRAAVDNPDGPLVGGRAAIG
jgi:protoporphyrinogen oxidase